MTCIKFILTGFAVIALSGTALATSPDCHTLKGFAIGIKAPEINCGQSIGALGPQFIALHDTIYKTSGLIKNDLIPILESSASKTGMGALAENLDNSIADLDKGQYYSRLESCLALRTQMESLATNVTAISVIVCSK